FGKPVCKNARRKVRRRAGCEADQDFYRPVRIIGLRRSRLRGQQHKQRGEQVRNEPHRSLHRSACPFGRSLLQDLEGSLTRQSRPVQFKAVAGATQSSPALLVTTVARPRQSACPTSPWAPLRQEPLQPRQQLVQTKQRIRRPVSLRWNRSAA